jgi:hypothetical protein
LKKFLVSVWTCQCINRFLKSILLRIRWQLNANLHRSQLYTAIQICLFIGRTFDLRKFKITPVDLF